MLVRFLSLSCCLALFCSSAFAQETKAKKKSAEPTAAANTQTELQSIRQSSKLFVAAFDKADAKAVAALWTESGEYVDDTGSTFTGRKAIEKEYDRFFTENPGHKITLAIDSLKLLSDSAAIEDGRAILDPAPAGAPAISKYTVVHVKIDGQWLMSSVRDTHVPTPSAYRHLEDFEWLIGNWSAEEHGAKTEVTCRWIANKSFVERSFKVTKDGQVTAAGVQIIGWNPVASAPQSWLFASDGGQTMGKWTARENGWQIESQGILADGTPTTAVTTFVKLDEEAFAWQSLSRTVGGRKLPDTEEIVLKRTK
ncbi:YybH family protein [Anatilimnocola floriformis]|uniref:YybH family protein n=1 Tax=Anatilimnocola floriformis TaxID=2948575 RepID=UPI0020C353D2|nr:SgcJ/EcaC family oxidoreductase [Anatilimnocola floriformis]